MSNVNQEYIDSLSLEELRRELKYSLEVQYGILFALRDNPLIPSPFILLHLGTAAKWPEDSKTGKELQRKLGSEAIPYKSECECGAGLWTRIRKGLLA